MSYLMVQAFQRFAGSLDVTNCMEPLAFTITHLRLNLQPTQRIAHLANRSLSDIKVHFLLKLHIKIPYTVILLNHIEYKISSKIILQREYFLNQELEWQLSQKMKSQLCPGSTLDSHMVMKHKIGSTYMTEYGEKLGHPQKGNKIEYEHINQYLE